MHQRCLEEDGNERGEEEIAVEEDKKNNRRMMHCLEGQEHLTDRQLSSRTLQREKGKQQTEARIHLVTIQFVFAHDLDCHLLSRFQFSRFVHV